MAAGAVDAVLLADSVPYPGHVAGLTLVERARRVAGRVGAARVLVIDGPAARAGLAAWWSAPDRAARLLVLRAGDQLVHPPLVQPLLATDGSAIAVVPPTPAASDLAPGAVAGAVLAAGADASAAIGALAAGADVDEVAALMPGAARCPHGEVARHPVRDAGERAAAQKLLYRILIKPQDNAITRYLYRPVSLPLTRLLVKTPITPNQVSYLVALLVGFGIWLTAHRQMGHVIAGTAVILGASYLDCCDGEIARVKLLSSKFGAWLDTIVDELSSLGYMIALGWHCHLYFGPHYLDGVGWPGGSLDPFLAAAGIAAVGYVITIYVVYWNIIVMVGSANSQDYVGRFDAVAGDGPGEMRLVPAAATAAIYARKPLPQPIKLVADYLPYVVRRDFIAWGAVVLAALHQTHVSFALQAIGGVVTAIIVGLDHVRVRRQRGAIARAGQRLVR